MRINKFIAQAGLASRRGAEKLILGGHVSLNGEVISNLAFQVTKEMEILVDGVPVLREEPVYFLLNKPRGTISSREDEKGRPTVLDLLPQITERIYPVGRLDWDTSGLLLLTNDGEFANHMMHPSHQIEKTYLAKIEGGATTEKLRPLTRGITIDGEKLAPARYKILKTDKSKNNSVVELTIHEGRNHQVKKMFESIGLPVKKLSRTQYGHLTLEGVSGGNYRRLTKKEVAELVTQS